MAVVTSDFLAGLFTNFRVIWEEAFLAAASAVGYERYCTVIPSSTDTESYNWLGTVPQMKQWTDQRQMQGFNSFNYSLKNLHYEASVEVDRDTLEDDKYNLIQPRLSQLGMEAARFPAQQAVLTLVAGGSTPGYDGVNFFATTHVEGDSGTQVNTNSGTGTTLAQIRADFITARTRMRRIKDDKGRVMNLQPDLAIIPPDLQDVFEQLITTNIIALASGTQQSNVLQGAVDIMVDANLTDLNDWFLLCTKQAIKPILFQNRKNPEFVALTNPDASVVFRTRMFQYGVDSRFGIGYGLWQMAQRVTN